MRFGVQKIDYEKLKSFNGLKALMCVLVVLFHYTSRYNQLFEEKPFLIDFPYGGKVGVFAFFLISGYLTILTIGKCSSEGGVKWLAHKLFRLFPSFVVANVVIWGALNILSLPGRDNPSFVDLLINLTMIPGLSGYLDTAHWYVMSLVLFYVEIFLLNFFKVKIGWPLFLTVLLFNLLAVLNKHVHFLLPGCEDDLVLFVSTYACNLQVFCGVIMFYAIHKNTKYWIWLFLFYLAIRQIYLFPIVLLVGGLIALPLNYRCISSLRRVLSAKALTFVGGVSYIWYLVHQNIGYAIMRFCGDGFKHDLKPLIAMIATFVLAFFLFVFLSFLKKIMSRHEKSD